MHRRGFTLIEMAIVLVIMGVLTAILVPTVVNVIQREKISQGKLGVGSIRDQLIGYAIDNEYLPNDSGGAYSGISDPALNNPVDVWNTRYSYRVNTYLNEDALAASGSICDVKSTEPDVQNALQVTNSAGDVEAVAFVTVSGGPDGNIDTILNADPIDITPSEVGDDLVEYVTLTHLKALLNCGATSSDDDNGNGGIGGDPQISFTNNIDDFHSPIKNGGYAGDGITVDTNEKTISLKLSPGRNVSSCMWYEGDNAAANCTTGNCNFNRSIMAYFKFWAPDPFEDVYGWDDNGGFTFSVIAAEDSSDYIPCGSFQPEDLGYAGQHGGTPRIDPPKMAVEFDFSPSGNNKGELQDSWDTYIRRHYGIVFWGDTYSSPDDNTHGDDGDADNGGNPAFLPSNKVDVGYAHTTAIYKFDNDPTNPWGSEDDDWFTDGYVYEARIQFVRGGNQLNATAWLRRGSTAPDFADMTTAYSSDGDYKISWSKTFSDEIMEKLDRVKVGWTMAMGEEGEVKISDFALRFD